MRLVGLSGGEPISRQRAVSGQSMNGLDGGGRVGGGRGGGGWSGMRNPAAGADNAACLPPSLAQQDAPRHGPLSLKTAQKQA